MKHITLLYEHISRWFDTIVKPLVLTY